jgi:hypothetical protein
MYPKSTRRSILIGVGDLRGLKEVIDEVGNPSLLGGSPAGEPLTKRRNRKEPNATHEHVGQFVHDLAKLALTKPKGLCGLLGAESKPLG